MNPPLRRKVLIVDDDAAVRRVLRTMLEADGLEVTEAVDGPDALEQLNHGDPDAVVLDVMMPGLDGIEVCRRIDHSRTKVLILSALTDDETRRQAAAAGATGYLTKPFSAVELLDAIETLAKS